jgi:hypothetical protein
VVELLVVIGILIGIISTLVVGLGFAARRARLANTDYLMNSIMTGLVQFKNETGYLPPVLGDTGQLDVASYPLPQVGASFGWARDVVEPPDLPAATDGGPDQGNWSEQQYLAVQRWFSVTTLPEYLVGPGDRSEDGYGVILDTNGALPPERSPGYREQPALGIRNPGQDGAWGAFLNPRDGQSADGKFRSRNLAQRDVGWNGPADTAQPAQWTQAQRASLRNPNLKGPSLGPYFELKNESDIGGFVGLDQSGTPTAIRPGEQPPSTGTVGFSGFDAAPKAMLDYFGNPIMYYRRGYLGRNPKELDARFSLADVVALRPSVFADGEAIKARRDSNNQVTDPDDGSIGDKGASRIALAAECALFSFGPDRRWNQTVRADPDGFNEDNIVRFGP